MALRTLFFPAAALLLLAGCGSPDATYKNGCLSMMKKQEDATREEGQTFCSCLSENSEELSANDKKTLGKLMGDAEDGQEFRIGLEEANQEGEISAEGAALFFSAAKQCSIDLAL